MGVPEGSCICRKEMASSVETAGTSLTGMRTRERRRVPDQSEGGAMTQTRTAHKNESESGAETLKHKVNKTGQRGSTNSSSNHAPLATTITSAPNSTNSLKPSARKISNTERAAPANSKVLANRKE